MRFKITTIVEAPDRERLEDIMTYSGETQFSDYREYFDGTNDVLMESVVVEELPA